MTNPPFRTEVLRLRRWCGDPLVPVRPAAAAWSGPREATAIEVVVAHLEPIRSRSSLLSSFAREASHSDRVRTAYAIRWIELGSGIAATGVSRARRRRVIQPTRGGRT